jgi:hypothetical protein
MDSANRISRKHKRGRNSAREDRAQTIYMDSANRTSRKHKRAPAHIHNSSNQIPVRCIVLTHRNSTTKPHRLCSDQRLSQTTRRNTACPTLCRVTHPPEARDDRDQNNMHPSTPAINKDQSRHNHTINRNQAIRQATRNRVMRHSPHRTEPTCTADRINRATFLSLATSSDCRAKSPAE